MNKYIEYLKSIPKGISNPKEVLEGWWNDYNFENLPKDEIEEILKRRAICHSCPFNSLNAQTSKEYFDIFGEHYKTDRKDEHCSICGCPSTKVTASLNSECRLAENDKTKHLQLKWNKYKQ